MQRDAASISRLGPELMGRVVAQGLPAYTERTVTDPVDAVATLVLEADSEVVAALSAAVGSGSVDLLSQLLDQTAEMLAGNAGEGTMGQGRAGSILGHIRRMRATVLISRPDRDHLSPTEL